MPVLLSVGYAACHWCHVMAHESFEDAATAAYMNEHFVNIKVDREERPDVDAVYMQATTAMTGHGGWPMTCVLDHDGEPFFAGTYFPDQPRHGQPAFTQVLQALTDAWADRGDEVPRVAGDAARAPATQAVATGAGDEDVAELWSGAVIDAGAASSTSRPAASAERPSSRRRWCWSSCCASRAAPARRRRLAGCSTRRCEAMARGGIYDQLAGGFARYSVDRFWVVPHFEKMLYDNAQLLGVYAGWGDRPRRDRVAEGIADFLLGELRTPEGGFASALDADSEGDEGTLLRLDPARSWSTCSGGRRRVGGELLGVTDPGTFEHGSSTLQLLADPGRPGAWSRVRSGCSGRPAPPRVRPARDDKVVAAWNGLAISGLCRRRAAARGRRTSTPRSSRVAALATCTWSTGACAGSRATAWSVRHAACSRTTAASRPASWPCCRRPATRSGSTAPVSARRGAANTSPRTTAASSTRPTTPRRSWSGRGTRPTTRRRPASLAAARAGGVRRGDGRGSAPRRRRRPSRRRRGRPPGASLRRLDARRRRGDAAGPVEVAVVGSPSGSRRSRRRASRQPGRVWSSGQTPTPDPAPVRGRRSTVDPRRTCAAGFVSDAR